MTRAGPVPGALLALVLAGCGADSGTGLTAGDVRILAPLPGQDTVVAYLTLTNRGDTPVGITGVTSPEFGSVEMHATIYSGDVARMVMLDELTVGADSSVELTTGGRHLMLMDPRVSLAPGDEVTLEFEYGADAPLRVSAPLEPRDLAD